ncbi:pectin lyase-like protein [Coniochaeta ligniaria NRRL 30616]|uniref:Pectin lyase-like protein n=1 Tax=Coniochaeta ligniaria NRRL 30616 TaxID=1408157 RepID=A0A1J7I7B7_9PEZI|nr:pectin lyase-like protein [Coniochaeta ligniaria NRRL 30616]
MALLRLVACLATCLLLHFMPTAMAQYYQDYTPHDGSLTRNLQSKPLASEPELEVVNLSPETVVLVYNCYYMKAICENAEQYFGTSRGKHPHPISGLSAEIFGYDFNTGKQSRQNSRRQHSCPGTWKKGHSCPEQLPETVMRHDGPWWTTALEAFTSVNQLANKRDVNGNIIEYSKVRYTCDEFPPASWVEGGDNTDGLSPSNTRCAGMRCGTGVKAEQDWQGTAHRRLRSELRRLIAQRPNAFPTFDEKKSVVLFRLVPVYQLDFVAARVWTFPTIPSNQWSGPGDDPRATNALHISQARRNAEDATNSTTRFPWHWTASAEELQELIRRGEGTDFAVHAKDMGGGDIHFPTDYDEDDEIDEDGYVNTTSSSSSSSSRAQMAAEVEVRRAPASALLPTRRQQSVWGNASEPAATPLLSNATATDLQRARGIVQKAIAESSKLNKARLGNPLRNNYGLKPGTDVGQSRTARRRLHARAFEEAPAPLLEITDEIARAAALVAESDAVAIAGNVTRRAAAAAGTYWMGSIARRGTVPWGTDATYKVFRSVLDYGAVGNGVTDDTAAIKRAMTDGNRCGAKCNGATTKNAIVYFPPGTYLISSTIPLPFGTQVIGDANNRPLLKASGSFVGMGVLSTDEYTGSGIKGSDGGDEEYYINTANFYRQLRNVRIDVTAAPAGQQVTCLHYQVAQATSMQNVELIAGPAQIGMFAENGSGGQISDVTFTGGSVGLYAGSQQFTAQRLIFSGCTVGVQVIWDWGWTWKSITMRGVGTGFKLVPDAGQTGNTGSASIIDSSFTNVGTVAVVTPPSSKPGSGSTGLVLENVALSGVTKAIADTTGKTLLAQSSGIVDEWVLGPVYEGSAADRSFSTGGKIGTYRRQQGLVDGNGAYFERAKPQYESLAVGDFVHVKDYATGDGSTDDTAAFQTALYASVGKVLFVDAGSYILTSTVTVPLGAKIVGETWSQLVASGPNPKVMLQVGAAGQVGSVEMQDLLFTTRGPTAGVVLVEWNIQAASPGSAALWDCHARVGGATGTQLTPAECPPVTSGIDSGCSAASLMMHLTPSASGYFENMWLWGADHMIDDPDLNSASNDMVQISVYVARGFLIESTRATWLYATASEHAVFYQFNFNKASNIFAGLLQTESPYYQPTPPPPAPFKAVVGLFPGDPEYKCTPGDEFGGCDESWAIMIRQSSDIFVAGAGLYSWFSTYAQTCIDSQACQKALLLLDSNAASVRIEHLVTIGAKYMAVMDGKGIPAAENLNVNSHPFWSQISLLDVSSTGQQFNNLVWIDPAIWEMDQPQFTCSPPCDVKIPPWTGATSTVDYPLLTVSAGTWTSTITMPPLTISQWVFEVVTLTQGPAARDLEKRQGFDDFWPKPAQPTTWPSVTYTGPDFSATVVGPKVPFPTLPAVLGPDTAPPTSGRWPARAVRPKVGLLDNPLVAECMYYDWMECSDEFGLNDWGVVSNDPGDDFDENWEDVSVTCPVESKTSSTPTASATPKVTLQLANPMFNTVDCYESGLHTEHAVLDGADRDACNDVGRAGPVFTLPYKYARRFDLNVKPGSLAARVDVNFEVKPNCTYTWTYSECMDYMSIPVDSCNCGGVDRKQGGTAENNCLYVRVDPNITF